MENKENDIFEEYLDKSKHENTVENPCVEIPKKPFYKKTGFWVLIVVVVGLTIAILFGNYDAKNEMVKYNNEQIMPLVEEFLKLDDEITTLIGLDKNAAEIGNEIKNELLPRMDEIIKKAYEISPKEGEIKNLHGIFKESISKYRDSIDLLIRSIETDDENIFEESRKMYSEASKKFEEFVGKREELRKKYHLEVQE